MNYFAAEVKLFEPESCVVHRHRIAAGCVRGADRGAAGTEGAHRRQGLVGGGEEPASDAEVSGRGWGCGGAARLRGDKGCRGSAILNVGIAVGCAAAAR